MNVVEILPHDLAVIAALETIGKPVGFTKAPPGALEALQGGGDDYIVVHPIDGDRRGSSIDDATGDALLVYQTTIVAKQPDGARSLIDLIEAALLAVAIPGRHVVRVTPHGVGGVRPDESVQPPVFQATPRWRLWTSTPA